VSAPSETSKARVTLIAGDGIGPEVTAATVRLLEAAGAEINWVEKKAQPIVGRRAEDIEADPVVASLLETRVGLKGPLTTPIAGGHQSINVALRKHSTFMPTFAL
jgi:isocitrate dehydrogenase (NAD+)